MNYIVKKVYDTVLNEKMIVNGDKILVGLSGGADSVFLTLMLCELKKHIDFTICCAHVNHGIRGTEAMYDEKFSEDFCKRNNIKLFKCSLDIPAIAKKRSISEEMAGREERYRFFEKILTDNNMTKIAVAHNMNDSIETVILNMVRGSSLSGLCGIKPVNGSVIRPIISVKRDEIEKYLSDVGQKYCTDSTNSSDVYTRNKIRNNIIKQMEEINPSFISTMYSNLKSLTNDDSFIEACAQSTDCIKKYDGYVNIDRAKFQSLETALKSRVILNAFRLLKGNCSNITSTHIDIISNADLVGKSYDMPDGITVKIDFENIVFIKDYSSQTEFEYKISVGESISYLQGYTLSVQYCDKFIADDKDAVYIDADKLKSEFLVVRNRRNGDKFVPYGYNHTKKLKQLFVELKISSHLRDAVPVVCDSDGIVAIVPYRICDNYKITDATKQMIKIKLTKE